MINKKRACDEADHIFCISENTRKDLIKIFDINPEKTTVTHLAFVSDFNLNKPKKIPNMRPFILFIGWRERFKNFKNLLKAYASNQELNQYFDLVAFGGGKFTKSEINLITELGLSKVMSFIKEEEIQFLEIFIKAPLYLFVLQNMRDSVYLFLRL